MSYSMTIDLGPNALDDGYGLLRLPRMTEQEFWDLCQRNPQVLFERNAEGDVILMAPADSWTDSRGGEFFLDLGIWNRQIPEPGIVFGPSAGFTLPDGAIRSPDAAWISHTRWTALSVEQRRPFVHLAPDFVAEIMSPSDRLRDAQDKMEEYRENGVRLGWLIDRKDRKVYVYRPGQPMMVWNDPATVSGDPELPGFVADMARVFLRDTGE